jgi:hypothetical protein
MEKITGGVIYKIAVGEGPRSSLSLERGQVLTIKEHKVTITQIVEDHAHFYYFKEVRYLVYAKMEGHPEFILRSFIGMPVSITYDLPVNGQRLPQD